MKTVQVVLDEALLQATDDASVRTKQNRSEVVRDALRGQLRRLESLQKEAAGRRGYEGISDGAEGWSAWEKEAAWQTE